MPQPKVIFLDAVGTLFGVRGSVGAIYAALAIEFGVEVDVEQLDRAFYQSFKTSPKMASPGIAIAEIPSYEKQWWFAIAHSTFKQVGVLEQFTNFSLFFDKLYDYFASDSPWFIYPEVISILKHWQASGIELGVISNFDTRIYPVLKVLELDQFFTSVTISTEVGAAKPEPAIFLHALQKHGHPAEFACHIGDSFAEDYQGAISIGLKGIWLNRSNTSITKFTNDPVNAIATLDECF
jgi:putative hydrolase of the HAD superfamily